MILVIIYDPLGKARIMYFFTVTILTILIIFITSGLDKHYRVNAFIEPNTVLPHAQHISTKQISVTWMEVENTILKK